MTEIPEHLLARSKSARARLTGAGGGDDAPATAPAATSLEPTAAAAPAAAAAAAAPVAPAPPAPKPPMVVAAESRTKIPVWAMPVLVLLPLWAIVYMATNDLPTAKTAGPLTNGDTVYSTNCSGCHGATGQGSGAFPKLADGAVTATFPDPADQVRWVLLGSTGFQAEGKTTYGATDKPIKGGMPGWDALEPAELLDVIRHERETLSGEEFDVTKWEAAVTALEADENAAVAEKAAEFGAVIESWKTAAPGT